MYSDAPTDANEKPLGRFPPRFDKTMLSLDNGNLKPSPVTIITAKHNNIKMLDRDTNTKFVVDCGNKATA